MQRNINRTSFKKYHFISELIFMLQEVSSHEKYETFLCRRHFCLAKGKSYEKNKGRKLLSLLIYQLHYLYLKSTHN